MIRYMLIFSMLLSQVSSDNSGNRLESLLPPTDIGVIITGVQHSESLISSGRGNFILLAADKIATTSGVFAFDGPKSYFKVGGMFSNKQKKHPVELIFNGEMLLTINQHEKKPNKFFVIAEYGYGIANEEDPRDWGYWYRRVPLSEYLTTHDGRLIGTELLKQPDVESTTPCYIVEADDKLSASGSVRFWIAPEKGFRCLQMQHEVRGMVPEGDTNITVIKLLTQRLYYQRYKLSDDTSVWYLKTGVQTVTNKAEDLPPSEVVMEISHFTPNVDTSVLFKPKLKPDQEVFHGNLRKDVRFEELGW